MILKKDLETLNFLFRSKKKNEGFYRAGKLLVKFLWRRIPRENKLVDLLPAKTSLFSEIIQNTLAIKSFIEFGSNTGVNLIAIKT